MVLEVNKIYLIFVLLVIFPVVLFAASSNEYFEKGINAYISGDLNAAEENFNECLKLRPDHIDAKAALLKIYIDEGKNFYKIKRFSTSLEYFKKAQKISPKNKTVLKYMSLCQNALETKKDKSNTLLSEHEKRILYGAYRRVKNLENEIEKFKSELDSIKNNDVYLKNEIKEREKFIFYLKISIGALIFIFILFLAVYIHRRKKYSGIILSGFKTGVHLSDSFVNNINFKHLEKKFKGADVNEKIKYIKKLYEVDENETLNILKQMMLVDDIHINVLAVKCLKGIGSMKCLNLLMQVSTPDVLRKDALKKELNTAFKKIADLNKNKISANQWKYINKIIGG